MSTTQFVEIYHPLLPDTAVTPVRVALQSLDEHAARGWLLVDPEGVLPTPDTPYYTKEALLSQIQGGASPIGTALRAAFVAGQVLDSDLQPIPTKRLTVVLTADGLDIEDLIIEDVA